MESMEADKLPSHLRVLSLGNSISTTFVIRSVIKLGIPDVLAKSNKPMHFTEIVTQLDESTKKEHNPDVIRRLLKSLCRRNIFQESSSGYFEHNDLSSCLMSEAPNPAAPMLMLSTSEPTMTAWQHLDEMALVENSAMSAFEKANGKSLYEFAGNDPSFGKTLMRAVPFLSGIIMPTVLKNYAGFKSLEDKVLVDVGGGNGICISSIVQAYPKIKGINYDIPPALTNAPEYSGVKHVPGNMFASIPPADAIFMKTVLHNWNDDKCKELLKNCYNTLPENGKLIIVDMIYDPSEKQATGFDSDIMMLLVTGGKERSQPEWEQLLQSQGFSDITFINLPMIKEGIIEAYKRDCSKLVL